MPREGWLGVSVWPARPGPRTRRLDLGIRLVIVATSLVQFVPGVLAQFDRDHTALAILIGVCTLAGFTLLLADGAQIWGYGLVALGTMLVPLLGFPAESTASTAGMNIVIILVASRLRPIPAATTILTWCLGFALVWSRAPGGPAMATLVDHMVLGATLGCVVSLGVRAMVLGTQRLDRLHAQELDRDLDTQHTQQEIRLREDFRHLLHDRVVYLLQQVADTGQVNQESLNGLRAGLGSVEQIAVDATSPRLETIIDAVARQFGAATALTAPSRSWPELTAQQALALVRILEELLRNAQRHGAGRATITASFADGQFTVRVVNEGRLLGDARGWGWTLLQRQAEELGGRASLAADGGSVIAVVTWPASTAHRPGSTSAYEETVASAGVDLPLLLSAFWPALIGNTYIALRYTPVEDYPVQLPIIAMFWAIALWLKRRLESRAVTWPLVFGVLAVITPAISVSLAVAGPHSVRFFESWVLGLACIPLAVLSFFGSTKAALLAAACATLPVVAICIRFPEVGWSRAAGAFAATLFPLIAHAVGALVRSWGRSAELIEAQVRDSAAASLTRWSARRTDGTLLGPLRSTVTPLLEELADDPDSAAHPDVRMRAHLLAQQVRDELNAPGLLDPALRGRIMRARDNGTLVDVHAGTDTPPPTTSLAVRLLDRLLDVARPGDRIQLILRPPEHTWSLTLVAADAHDRLGALLTTCGPDGVALSRDAFSASLLICGYPDPGIDADLVAGIQGQT